MQMSVFLLMFVMAGAIQRVETQYPNREKVTRVETAMNHLTVIELTEPVTLAAAGSPSFKIERRENKVFIQPLEEAASTNLFVWTASGRWNYELVPASSIETMHFAIDQKPSAVSQSDDKKAPEAAALNSGMSASFAEEMLLLGKPVRALGVKSDSTSVGIHVTDIYRKDDQLFIRYIIDNRTTRPYAGGQPEVFMLNSAHSRTSLHTLRYSQVGVDIERQIRSDGLMRMATIDCDVPSEPIPSDQRATGIVILQLPVPLSEPAVLRLVFAPDGREPLAVTLVL